MALEAFPAPDRATKRLREKRRCPCALLSHTSAINRATSFLATTRRRGPAPPPPPQPSVLAGHRRAPDERGELALRPDRQSAPSVCEATAGRRARRSAPRRARRRSTARRARAGHRARRRQEVEVRERRPARRRAPVRAPEHDPFRVLGQSAPPRRPPKLGRRFLNPTPRRRAGAQRARCAAAGRSENTESRGASSSIAPRRQQQPGSCARPSASNQGWASIATNSVSCSAPLRRPSPAPAAALERERMRFCSSRAEMRGRGRRRRRPRSSAFAT